MSTAPGPLRTAFAVHLRCGGTITGLVVGALGALAGGCSRDALPSPCPDLAPGDLVLSEIRGPQSGDAAGFGEWIEIFNASGAAVDLAGLRVSVTKLDGSATASFLVRSRGIEVEADGYGVLGRFGRGDEPAHVDYGYQGDLDAELFTSGAIYIDACDVEVDRIIYRDLTDFGTLSLDGAIDPPSAEANNDEAAFCVDETLDDENPSAGVRGTPGEPNRACP